MDIKSLPARLSGIPPIQEGATSAGNDDLDLNKAQSSTVAEPHKQHIPRKPTEPFDQTLRNGEDLLNYAAEAGIEIEPDVAQQIVAATRQGAAIWDSSDAGALIASISKLATKVRPVTAESLRLCRKDARVMMRTYKWIAGVLAFLIIPLSIGAYITTRLSNTITTDLTNANALAVTLHAQLDGVTAPDISQAKLRGALADLQQFAMLMRAIYSRARQLDWPNPLHIRDPISEDYPDLQQRYSILQLPSDLALSMLALQAEVNAKTAVYQKVRLFATDVQDAISVVWGAINSCILPMLYALLGACAYLVRSFSKGIEAHTFSSSLATPARFIIAAIGGGVVGLFNNFTIGQNSSLSPLAVAFLVGYAADLFFNFLEGAIPTNGHKP